MFSSAVAGLLVTLLVVVSGQDFRCPEGPGFFPDPDECDLYYKCSKGKAETKLCPDGLVFNDGDPNHERCEIPANVDCGDRSALQEAKPSPGCPRQFGYYRHPDPRECGKFHNCVAGEPRELSCPPGLVFDDEASTCAWPGQGRRADCTDARRERLDDGFSCPEGETLGPDGRKQPHPTFAHPDDCQKFYICRNGVQPQRGSCPKGTVYNEELFKCDEPQNVPGCEDYFKTKKN